MHACLTGHGPIRGSALRALAMTVASGVYCILATIESVCGERCVHAKLHLWTDYPILHSSGTEACFPELAVALVTAQAKAFTEAIGSRTLFGFTAARRAEATDLFVATEDSVSGARVFKGVYRGEWMYRCPPASGQGETWAVTAYAWRAKPARDGVCH